MGVCDTCGNEYSKTMEVTSEGKTYTFDSFECAIEALAPACSHCQCRIIGHGVEHEGQFYCCHHCARAMGTEEEAPTSEPEKLVGT